MATYECKSCGMSKTICGKCDEMEYNLFQVSECPVGCGKIKSPLRYELSNLEIN